MLRFVFGSLGLPEILFILVLALLIFGPRKLPEIGKTLGKAMGEFRRATSDLKSSLEREVILEDKPPPVRRKPAAPKVEVESLEVEDDAPASKNEKAEKAPEEPADASPENEPSPSEG